MNTEAKSPKKTFVNKLNKEEKIKYPSFIKLMKLLSFLIRNFKCQKKKLLLRLRQNGRINVQFMKSL